MRSPLVAILVVAAFALAAPGDTAPANRPNIVLIIVDTLRADRIEGSRNGIAIMPNLHNLSNTGWNFKKAISASSWTKPSVASIMTGLYPSTHGLVRGTRMTLDASSEAERVDGLPAQKETMATYLRHQGYTTVAIQSNHLLGAVDGFAQGFGTYIERNGAASQEVNNAVFTQGALLKAPFFLYLQYMEPHAPYNPPAEHRDAFGALPALVETDQATMTQAKGFSNYYLDKLRFDTRMEETRKFPALGDSGREYYRTMYDGDCHYVDAQIKRMHDEITRHHPNTMFIVTADHGEELWEHGTIGHGRSLEQELIHVPMMVFGGKLLPRTVDNVWVEHVDLLPTLAGLLGTPPAPHWQGRNLAETDLAPKPVVAATRGMIVEAHTDLYSVIDGDQKLVRDGAGDVRVFVHKDARWVPTDTAHPKLQALLDAHLATAQAHPLAKVPPSKRGMDDEMLERLRALGYTAGESNP